VAERMRPIEWLRRKYPGAWTYDAAAREYRHADGWSVRACSHYSPRWEGDDGEGAFETRWRRDDTGERVDVGSGLALGDGGGR
jgi:hypothetical protein